MPPSPPPSSIYINMVRAGIFHNGQGRMATISSSVSMHLGSTKRETHQANKSG